LNYTREGHQCITCAPLPVSGGDQDRLRGGPGRAAWVGPPDSGWGAWCVAVEHGAVEEELEEGPVDARGGAVVAGQLVDDGDVEDFAGAAGQVGFGVAGLCWEGVQGEAAVAQEIVTFAGGDDEAVEGVVGDDGGDGVDPGSPVFADCGQVGHAAPILVQQLTDRCRELRVGAHERAPRNPRSHDQDHIEHMYEITTRHAESPVEQVEGLGCRGVALRS